MEKIKQPITIEQIKSGEIKGREALEFLQNTGDYVFHGSWQKLTELEPRQPYSYRKPDGELAVCASAVGDVAIFASLVNTPLCESDERFSSWGTDKNGVYIFKASESALEGVEKKGVHGHVHVFNKSDFEKYSYSECGTEYRTNKKIKPLFIVEVGKEDLPERIEIVSEKKY